MKISLIGHNLISARQYLLWEKVRQLGLAQVQVLAPERWGTERADPRYVTPCRVLMEGELHRYMLVVEPHIAQFKPDWIVSMTEFWRQQSIINLRVAKKYGAKIAFLRWENIPIDDTLPDIMKEFERQILAEADLLICGNEDAKRITRARTKLPIVKLIEAGIDVDIFKPVDVPHEETVLYLGRLNPWKGIQVIEEAVKGTPYKLILNDGTKPYEELPKLISSCSVGVVASIDQPGWREQCTYVIGEMLSCGLPVVSSDAGAIPEIWGKCEALKIVPQNNVEALRTAIVETIKHPPSRDVARRFILENCSNEIMAHRYVEALRKYS